MNTSEVNWTNRIFHLIILLAILVGLWVFFNKELWIEPDSTAFYNRTCLAGKDFETPVLSRAIFAALPCDLFYWKLFHLFIFLASVSSLYYFTKKVLKDKEWFYFAFLSYFLLGFLVNIEDDQIAFPIIIALSAMLLSNPSWRNKILYAIGLILITGLVWSGAMVPMIMVLSYTMFWALPILIPLGFLVFWFAVNGTIFFNDPGGTIELIAGRGFLTNDVPLLLLLFVKDKKRKILENKHLFGLFTGFNIIAFVYPKFAYYTVIPLLMIGFKLFDENQKQLLVLAGFLALLMAPSLMLYGTQPTKQQFEVIDQAVALQREGYPVYNEWGIGRWFHYRGGHATQEGGNAGYQFVPFKEYYWIGAHRKDCEAIAKTGLLVLEKCKGPS